MGSALQPPLLAQVRYVRHPGALGADSRRAWLRGVFGFFFCASLFLIVASGYIALNGSARARSWNWLNALVAFGSVVQTVTAAKRLKRLSAENR